MAILERPAAKHPGRGWSTTAMARTVEVRQMPMKAS
jgi:hypothetical protein